MLLKWESLLIHFLVFTFCTVIFHLELFLTWDASYHAFRILQTGEFLYFDRRWILYPMQFPLWAARNWFSMEDFNTLVALYGVAYSYYPFLATLGVTALLRAFDVGRWRLLIYTMTVACAFYYVHPLSEQLLAVCLFCLILATNWRYHLDPKSHWLALNVVLHVLLLGCHPVATLFFALEALQIHRLARGTRYGKIAIALLLGLMALKGYWVLDTESGKLDISVIWYELVRGRYYFPSGLRDFPWMTMVLVCFCAWWSSYRKGSTRLALGFLAIGFLSTPIWLGVYEESLGYVLTLRSILPFFPLALLIPCVLRAPTPPLALLPISLLLASFFLIQAGERRQDDLKLVRSYLAKAEGNCEYTGNGYRGHLNHWSGFFELAMSNRERSIQEFLVFPFTGTTCESAFTETHFTPSPWARVPLEGYFDLRAHAPE